MRVEGGPLFGGFIVDETLLRQSCSTIMQLRWRIITLHRADTRRLTPADCNQVTAPGIKTLDGKFWTPHREAVYCNEITAPALERNIQQAEMPTSRPGMASSTLAGTGGRGRVHRRQHLHLIAEGMAARSVDDRFKHAPATRGAVT